MSARGDWRTQKGSVPWFVWAWWGSIHAAALVVFYGLLTPLWLGLRGAAWIAELRARRRP